MAGPLRGEGGGANEEKKKITFFAASLTRVTKIVVEIRNNEYTFYVLQDSIQL